MRERRASSVHRPNLRVSCSLRASLPENRKENRIFGDSRRSVLHLSENVVDNVRQLRYNILNPVTNRARLHAIVGSNPTFPVRENGRAVKALVLEQAHATSALISDIGVYGEEANGRQSFKGRSSRSSNSSDLTPTSVTPYKLVGSTPTFATEKQSTITSTYKHSIAHRRASAS